MLQVRKEQLGGARSGMISGKQLRGIYHLLRGSLGDDIFVAVVVDLDVLYVVPVGDIHLCIDDSRLPSIGFGSGGLDWGDVDMLYALSGL